MSSPSIDKLYESYARLDKQLKDGDYETALALSSAILIVKADETEAFQAQCYALAQLDQYETLLSNLEKKSLLSKDQTIFQKAYCLYRLHRHGEALKLINSVQNPSTQLLHLKAQSLFRLEDAGSAEVYRKLIESLKQTDTELTVNLIASLTRSHQSESAKSVVNSEKSLMNTSFDLCYNAACALIETGEFDLAEEHLTLAEEVCRRTMKEQNASREELSNELAPILTQMAYIKQRRGQDKESMALYEQILESEPTDLSVSAVCNNNIVALRGREADSFNSLNRLTTISKKQTQEKLSKSQKRTVLFNRCLLLLQVGKLDECNQLTRQLSHDFPNSELVALIQAAVLVKKQQHNKATEVLKEFVRASIKDSSISSLRVQLSLVQILYAQGNIKEAIERLKTISQLQNEPSFMATLVQLYERVGDLQGAISILDDAARKLLNSKDKKDHILAKSILKKSVQLKMDNNLWSQAIETLTKILELDPKDVQIKATLALACVKLDPSKAEGYLSDLPKIPSSSDINVDALEATVGPSIRRPEPIAVSPLAAATTTPTTVAQKKKKNRKRKNKPAKKALPGATADPERWIPRKERTAKRRGGPAATKGGHAVGHQGTSANEALLNKANTPSSSSSSGKAPPAAAKAPPKGAAKRGRGGRRR